MRAVDALMECLKAEGVDVVFGLPGGANLPTYDAFYDAGIRHILVRHEAGGGHAAEGYAKATGRVGVAFATSGPGATNVVTPICDAMMDSVPVVFVTGQVRTELLGTDGFQEADTIGMTMPVVKHSFLIQHPLEIPRTIHEAFHIARTGRPGPVVVDIPMDLSRADIAYEPVKDVHLPGYQPTTDGNQKQIRLAAKALANARRPVLYAGGGVILANAAPRGAEYPSWRIDILPRLTAEYRGLGAEPARLEEWWSRIRAWRERHPLSYEDSVDAEIKPQFAIQALYEATGGDAIITSDVGQHQMWAAQYYHYREPRTWISSGGLGTMGFGLPAAMGAKVGCPDKTVVCVSGDGSIQMNAQELATCSQEGIAVKVFILNNGYLGMVRQWQELFWDRRYSNVEMGRWPDFVKLAEAYGATGIRLEDKHTLLGDVREALETEGPVVVDVRVTDEENVYPMIPAGQAARDMVG